VAVLLGWIALWHNAGKVRHDPTPENDPRRTVETAL
jgi:hypothetical protein